MEVKFFIPMIGIERLCLLEPQNLKKIMTQIDEYDEYKVRKQAEALAGAINKQ